MRNVRFALIAIALVALPLPVVAAATLSAEGSTAFLALKRAALEGVEASEFPTTLAERSLVPADDAAAAWTNVSGASDARVRIIRAEAELMRLASRNALAAHDAGDASASAEWLELALSRIDWRARDVPADTILEGEHDRESLEEILRAAAAIRAREEIVQSALLRRAGLASAADESAQGALALLTLLLSDADALPAGLRTPFLENATKPVRGVDPPTGLMAPLAALEYDRDVERLDELGVRIADAAFVAARAAREDPALFEVLAMRAAAGYAADRAPLYLAGEGTLEEVDAAWARFEQAVAAADADAVASAAADVHAALRPVALLERGIVLKVETGGIQPGREHVYTVWLIRPPLEGLASWRVTLEFDPSVVEITNVTPRGQTDGFLSDIGNGTVSFGGDDQQIRRSAVVAHLHLRAVGEPASRTDLRVANASFHEPDGDAAQVFLLRDGSAEVAILELDPSDAEAEPAPKETGHAAPLLALAALALAARGRRRS